MKLICYFDTLKNFSAGRAIHRFLSFLFPDVKFLADCSAICWKSRVFYADKQNDPDNGCQKF